MTLTKTQSAEYAKLLNGLNVTIKGQSFTHAKQRKYGAAYTGNRGATYNCTVMPRAQIIEDKNLPVFLLSKDRVIGRFTVINGEVVELI